jgi:hypothetical protein
MAIKINYSTGDIGGTHLDYIAFAHNIHDKLWDHCKELGCFDYPSKDDIELWDAEIIEISKMDYLNAQIGLRCALWAIDSLSNELIKTTIGNLSMKSRSDDADKIHN